MHTLVTRKPRTPEKSRVRGSSVFIIPCARHFVFIQVDLIGDVFICHDVCSFRRGLSGQEKTTLVHERPKVNLILGTKAGKLLRCHPNWRKCARSATCHHTPFLGNGGKSPSDFTASRRLVRPLQSIRQGRLCCARTGRQLSGKDANPRLLLCFCGLLL